MPAILTFTRFTLEYPHVTFEYHFAGEPWRRSLDLSGIPRDELERVPPGMLDNLLAHLGLSYCVPLFVLADFDRVHVDAFQVPPRGIDFFTRAFSGGLSEFRFRNGLDVRKRVRVTCGADAPRFQAGLIDAVDAAVLMNGGGKDTAVAGEILHDLGVPFTWFTCDPTPASRGIVERSHNRAAIWIKNQPLDQRLKAGARFRPYLPPRLGFSGVLAAMARRARYLVAANEYSANFGNGVVDGVPVNHQAGKSLRAERAFCEYIRDHIVGDLHYFSIVAPLYELQIARLFVDHPEYWSCFVSCNRGIVQNQWCGRCPKCVFIFLILAAHVHRDRVAAIFGGDLLRSEEGAAWIARLVGPGRKPFECVGTKAESRLALSLALRDCAPESVHPIVWQSHQRWCAGDQAAMEAEILGHSGRPHNFPAGLAPAITRYFMTRIDARA